MSDILAPPTTTTTTTPAGPTAEQRVAALEARLAQLEPLAARGAQAAAAESAALAAQVARLSPADQAAVANLNEADRAAVTARLRAAPGAFKTPPMIGGGPPPPAMGNNIAELLANGVLARTLKAERPEDFAAYIASITPPPKAATAYANFMAVSREKQLAAAARGHRR